MNSTLATVSILHQAQRSRYSFKTKEISCRSRLAGAVGEIVIWSFLKIKNDYSLDIRFA